MRARALGALLLLSLAGREPAAAQRPAPPEDTARAVHLLRRATFGARPADLDELLRLGRDAWLERQLHPDRLDDAALEARLDRIPAARLSVAQLFERFPPPRPAARPSPPADSLRPDTVRRRVRTRGAQQLVAELVTAKLTRAAFSERQLEEVMTDFWFNHFNVFAGKRPVGWLVSDYERTAIRPHVFGRFEEMLLATARHPAMLVYLDNARSVAPDSARGRGLNENYARELLELHTLGVDAGYTQRDVTEVARVFTGWTLDRPARGKQSPAGVGFAFRPRLHDAGEKTVLGERLRAGVGEREGVALLRRLASHPATARHLAGKLVRRFVADEPDPALVEELAGVFLRTGGDLRALTRALFTSERFYDARHRGGKLKQPFEVVASALRLTSDSVRVSPALLQSLRELGQVPYLEAAPTGFPAESQAWTSGGAMLARINLGLALGAGRVRGVALRPAVRRADGPEALAALLLPGTDTRELVRTLRADAQARDATPAARRARTLGLLLGSPEFQRR